MEKSKKRVLVAVTSDVYSDTRVLKVSDFLSKKGATVKVVGRNTSDFVLETPFHVKRFSLFFNRSFLFYAEYNLRFFWYALFQKVDLIVANDLDTLLSTYLISKIKRIPIVYDSHEYFTESVGLQGRKLPKKVWEYLEKQILPSIQFAYTVSPYIQQQYLVKYKVAFELVRNFPSKELKIEKLTPHPFPGKKIILYQGVFNPHRGLDHTIHAMQFLSDEYLFLLIGYGEEETKLKEIVRTKNLDNKVKFLGKMPYLEMMRYTSIAHLGIALEEPVGESFTYSLPNKVFDYMHQNLPFISRGTPEVLRYISEHGIGILIDFNSAEELAKHLISTLSNSELLATIQENQKKAKNLFNWENECHTLEKVYSILD